MTWNGFRGNTTRLSDFDLPRLGREIGVGEDEIHAVLEVEASGSGFDSMGRPKMLFEPHVFYRNLKGGPRDMAVRMGLAYSHWQPGKYPKDSYPRLVAAMGIDETAALKSASWGLPQILGENHIAAGYQTPQRMVRAFMEGGEAEHLAAMIRFIKHNRLDDELRRHDWAGFARGYNGPQYARHGYDKKLEAAFAKWKRIRDTPWTPGESGEVVAPVLPPPPDIPKPKPAPAKMSFWQALARVFGGA